VELAELSPQAASVDIRRAAAARHAGVLMPRRLSVATAVHIRADP
jgi:hypothetical protein